MNNQNIDIDRIVREIVDRLRAELQCQPAKVLAIDAKVITLAELNGKLSGIQQLKINSRAIVTPAARDQLKDHQIDIIRANHE